MTDEPPSRAGGWSSDRYRLLAQLVVVAGPALRAVPWCLLLFAVAWFTRDVLVAYAGQTTSANVIVKLIADLRVAVVVPWALAAGGVAYGLRQKHLKEDAIERLTKRPQELEKLIDPNRTSSQLTPRGRTNPKDR